MAVWLRINTVGEFGPWTVMIVTIVKDRYMVLPTDPADIKNPGSVVHGQWQDKSTRDPGRIGAWWRENYGYGIALHVGRSGAIAFDLDIDDLDVIARWSTIHSRGAALGGSDTAHPLCRRSWALRLCDETGGIIWQRSWCVPAVGAGAGM